MKTLKKLSCVALILVLALGLMTTAFAANVTISTSVPEDAEFTPDYTAYKIFDAAPLGESSTEKDDEIISSFKNVAYSIDKTSPFLDTIENFEENGTKVFNVYPKNETQNVVVLADGVTTFDAAALATALKAVIDSEADLTAYTTSFTGDSATLTDGYFLITSALGSKMIVDTFGQKDMTIKTKNELPTMTKIIAGIANGTVIEGNKAGTAAYGSVVTFKITVHIPATAVGTVTIHDEMDNDLTYNEGSLIGAVEVPTDETAAEGFTHRDFTIEVTEENAGSDIEVTYTATLNSDAPINDAIKNIAHLSYSNYETPKDEVEVKTFSFNLVKVNSDNVILSGAEFKLYDAETEGNEIAVVADGDGYRVATDGEEGVAIVAGKVTIKGLDAGTYYLEETVAPVGYNKLTDRMEVVVSAESVGDVNTITNPETQVVSYVVEGSVATAVVNRTGAELPSTGGIGTTIFYIVGGLLVVGACVLLVTRKRVDG